MKHATIAATLVVACVCLSVSASYFLFGRRPTPVIPPPYNDAKIVQRMGSAENRIQSIARTGAKQIDAEIKFMQSAVDSGMFDPHWWCGALGCERNEPYCERLIEDAVLKTKTAPEAAAYGQVKCVQTAIAYCNNRKCYGSLDQCIQFSLSTEPCFGVK